MGAIGLVVYAAESPFWASKPTARAASALLRIAICGVGAARARVDGGFQSPGLDDNLDTNAAVPAAVKVYQHGTQYLIALEFARSGNRAILHPERLSFPFGLLIRPSRLGD